MIQRICRNRISGETDFDIEHQETVKKLQVTFKISIPWDGDIKHIFLEILMAYMFLVTLTVDLYTIIFTLNRVYWLQRMWIVMDIIQTFLLRSVFEMKLESLSLWHH